MRGPPRAALAGIGLAASLGLAACGGGGDEQAAPAPSPTLDAGPRTLVAADLDLDRLGPRLVGPDGAEVESEVPGIGTLVSFVACPRQERDDGAAAQDRGAETCEPGMLPEGALYTYVHRVTLDGSAEDAAVTDGAATDGVAASGAGGGAAAEGAARGGAGTTMFRTTQRAPGFANVLGFSRDQAQEALGAGGDIKVQVENGRLIWRIAAGDGWTAGETLTFFWQSTRPPAGPQEAYALEAEGESAAATGPFPAEEAVDDTPPAR